MRDIKFRAWNGKNIIGASSVRANGSFALRDGLSDKDLLVIPTPKYEIMQYTGLKDKNGVEIYEGDIIKTNLYNIIGYVYYSSPSFGIKQKNGVCTDYNWSDFNNFEVIGNIYSNPDLLKG